MKKAHSCVWFEIPVRDLAAAKAFYGAVLELGFEEVEAGPNPIAIFDIEAKEGKPAGHLYPGTPAERGAGPTIHLHVDALEAGLERLGGAGGEVLSPPIEIPAGRFAYCLDPDGNSIALFERGDGG